MLLLGAAHYTAGLPELPAVGNNLRALRRELTDPEGGGLPDDRCRMALDPVNAGEVGRLLHAAAIEATDLLLVYYAGHGLVGGRRHELYLSLGSTDPAHPEFTAVPYRAVRDVFLDSPATNQVIILDCCFSGRALDGAMAGDGGLIGQIDVAGSYVLTSAPANSTAQAPVGAQYTAFTGELVRLLREGIANGPPLLSLGEIYRHVRAALHARGYAAPQQRSTEVADRLAIARNRYGRPAPPPSAPPKFDLFGSGTTPDGSGGGTSFSDLFSNIFSGGQPAARGRDMECTANLLFRDATRGVTLPLTVRTPTTCSACEGSGVKPGTPPCADCRGTGLIKTSTLDEPCRTCGGAGIDGEACSDCAGTGQETLQRTINVRFPAGIADGQRIRLAGRGEPSWSGHPPGDLYVLVQVNADPVFQRSGDDLMTTLPITAAQARNGADISAPTLEGSVTLRVPPGTPDGRMFRVRGKGVTVQGRTGDLLVRLAVR
ncbi:DnaJ C-terminal domain-containing protein [Micromonospora sp. CPCC 206061]